MYSILYGMSSSNLNKLQRVQNVLAVTVTMTNRREHITPVLAELHWLPVTARIEFKLALLTFKILTSHQLSYRRELLQPHRPSRQLRSSSHNLLDILRTRTVFAQCSFSHISHIYPRIWNSLPDTITCDLNITTCTFKRILKTFFFSNCY